MRLGKSQNLAKLGAPVFALNCSSRLSLLQIRLGVGVGQLDARLSAFVLHRLAQYTHAQK